MAIAFFFTRPMNKILESEREPEARRKCVFFSKEMCRVVETSEE